MSARKIDGLEGTYKGPKKVKASGKAAGTKKKPKSRASAAKGRSVKKKAGPRPSRPKEKAENRGNLMDSEGFAPIKKKK